MLCGTAFADYVKVTKTSDITDGDYLIVYETGNVAFNGALTTLDAESNTVAVTISDDKIVSSNAIDAAVFTIDGTNGTLKSASGLYIGVSSNSNGLKQIADASAYKNSFAINDNGDAVISAVYEGSTMSLRYNSASNQNRFRYYKNAGQEAIQLYKKVTTSSGSDNIVTNYAVDFNTSITTSAHDFKVASNWRHIVHRYNDGYSDYYMSYSYGAETGIEGSGALYVGQQRAGDYSDYETTYDFLVTPVVSGDITIYAKKSTTGTPFVEFWSLNETATAKNEKLHEVKTFENDTWTAVTYNVATPQRIGIRAQYVYLDNFSAANAVIEKEKSIMIATAEPSATTGTIYWDQQANGKVQVKYTVTVTNNGEVALTQGMENYSISVFNRKTNEVYFTVPVPQDLAIGATSDPFEVSGEIETTTWANSYTYINMDLMENLQGSTIQRAQSQYKAYEPKFIFRVAESTSSSSISSTQAYGMVSEATTRNFEIRNDGAAPLTIKSITLPEGFTSDNMPVIPTEGLVIAKYSSQPLNITLPIDANGAISGNLVIVYLDKNGAEQTYTLGFSGSVLAAGTWFADFNNTTNKAIFPEGSIAETGIRTDYSYNAGTYDYYLYSYTSSSYANANNKFITPKLHANANDKLTFDVRKDESGSSYNLKVYVSTDRKTWGEPKFSIAAADLTSAFQTKEITFEEAGDYYVAFAIYGVRVDNIIGLTKVDVAHDLFIKSVSWPDASVKSGTSIQKPSVEIIPLTNEAAKTYTVKYVCGEKVLAEADSVELTANSSKTFTFNWTPQVESTTKFEGTKVVFDFGNNVTFETESFDLTVTNEPIFHFVNTMPTSKWNEPSDVSKPIVFGKTNTADKQSFYVYNWGSAPLTVKSITVPAGFTATPAEQFIVPAFDENNMSTSAQAVEITFSATEANVYSGDMVITYQNGAGEDKTFTLAVSGTKLDPTKFYANFDDGGWPAGSVYQKSISNSNGGTYSEPNYYISSSSATDNIFVTPKLTAAAGDKLSFDAKLYSSYWNEGKVVVYAAATREEVLNAEEGTTRVQLFSVSGQDETNPMTTDYQTFEVTVPTAGDYFFGFEISGRPYVDEIYGLKTAAVAHDWMIASSSMPADAMQNKPATASVNILNLGLAAEAADSYTVTAYVDGKAVATGSAVALPTTNKLSDAGTQLTVDIQYPKAGTFPVYIEVKADDYSVKTTPVDVTFAEEVAVADAITVGTKSGNGRDYGFVDWYNNDGSNTRYTDILYPAAKLTAAGIKAGDKINSIAFRASNSAKTLNAVVTSWVGTSTGEITFGSPVKENMQEISLYNGSVDLPANFESVITLTTPIVWDGTSDIRVYTEAVGQGSGNWVSANYDYDSDIQMSYNGTTKAAPLAYITLATETSTFSGTVKDAEGAAVEGATVTLVSTDGDNIQYTGKTNAEGAYSINVIQNSRDYTAIATAPGYTTATKDIVFGGESKTADFVIAVPSTASLTNPSFEFSAEGTASNAQALTSGGTYYGWTLPNLGDSFVNISIGDATACNGNAFGIPTAKDGSLYYYTRRGWNSSTSADGTLSTTMTGMPEGSYTLTFAYKGLDSWDSGHNSKGSYLKVAAMSGETQLNAIQTPTFEAVNGNSAGANKFAGDANWNEISLRFNVESTNDIKLNIIHHLVGGVRTDVVIDNLTLTYKSFFAAAIEDLQAEIAKAEALKTEARTEGLTEFNAAIEDAKALLTSTDATAINAATEALKVAETAFLTAQLPVAEGTYYVYNTATQKFLSRGANWGTRAVADNYGVAIKLAVADLPNGLYTLTGFDNNLAYGEDGGMYSDKSGNKVINYSIAAVDGGFTMTNSSNSKVVYVNSDNTVNHDGVSGEATSAVWQFITKADRDSIVASVEARQKAAAFAAAGIAEDAKLAVADPTTLTFATGSTWTFTAARSGSKATTNDNGTEVYEGTGSFEQTIKKVEPGLYKVSIQAFYRNGGPDECAARYATTYNTVLAYLEANGNKVQVKSWAADKGDGNDPNSMAQAKAKFDEGKYLSEVYTFVGEDSTLNLTVNHPAHIGTGWFIASNVKYAKVDEFILAGDANLDEKVTTGDAVAAVNFALEVETPSEKAFKAADVNKSNSITVSDAVGIVNIALEITPEAPARSDMEAVNFLTMNGNALELMNTTEFVGFQMDVTLANGAMLNGVSLAERAAGLQVVYNRIADNTYRIIAFSAGNAAIEGNEGELFSLDITGNANVNITNIEFADAAANAYALGFGETTGIKGIYAGATNVESYTVGGIKNDKVRKGMNVVRTADGKVKKVYVK